MTEPLQPGQRLGAYRIIRPLGGGGMGQVYEAEHVSLGVRRALKVFTTESHHIDFLRKRFIAEGRILADLDHPRIVHVYDLVVDDETGTPYFAMDLVLSPDGTPRTLENEREAGVSEEKVAIWFKDICEGLAYIHSHKVVHRDISLDNILIGPDGHAVISDFGIAKIVDDNYRRKINVTVTMASKDAKDLCMGKGNYMAPELKRGGKETPASDAYALGVLLFRLLTGFWYEPNRLEKTKDLLAGFEYDWVSLIVKLCAANPQFRMTDEESIGIAATLKLPRPENVRIPFWKSSKFKVIVILVALGILSGIYYLPIEVDSRPSRSANEIIASAVSGHVDDMVKAAGLYRDGKKVEMDYAKSVDWYRKALSLGSYEAADGLGTMYENGWGVTSKPHTAYLLYLVAAANGVERAQKNIIRCYEKGIGIEKNLAEAKKWRRREAVKTIEKKRDDVLRGLDEDGVGEDAKW